MKVANYGIGEKYWKASHRCYFVKIVHPDGRREDHRLDPDEDKAEEIRAEKITAIRKVGTPSIDYSVRELCNRFLEHSEANNARKTYIGYRCYLKSFSATIPADLRVRDFKLHHVQNWLKRKYPATGNTNTRHDAVCCLKRVFNWAVNDMEYLDRSPLSKLKSPPTMSRATCLSKDQWATVLSYFTPDDPFYSFLQLLLQTGCRPQEARVIEARHIDWQAKKVHFEDGEVPGKKGERDILLTDAAMAILKKWALRYPEGPVLRNEDGNPWKPNALRCRLGRLRKSKKLPFRAHCYAARHSVATDMLEAGASTGAVAAVLGHRDPTMVLKVYGKHIDKREQHLRDCLKKATG
jgi:integrase